MRIKVDGKYLPYINTLVQQNGSTLSSISFELLVVIMNIENIPYTILSDDVVSNIEITDDVFNGKIVINKEAECSICLSIFKKDEKVTRLVCNHMFHTHCINRSVEFSNHCPICRNMIKVSLKESSIQGEKHGGEQGGEQGGEVLTDS